MRDGLGALGYRAALLVLRGWWAVRRPRSRGVRCVLRDGDAFVLVRHTYGDRGWMLPGGRIGRSEAPVETARREMEQELGVTGTGWREVGLLAARSGFRRESPEDAFRRHSTHFLEADVSRTELRPRRMELRDAGWFTLAELPDGCSEALDLAVEAGWL